MRSPASAFQTTIASDQMQPVFLCELQATTVLRYAFYAQDIIFSGETFTATDGEFGTWQQNAEGKAPQMKVSLQNLDNTLRDWLDGADRRGLTVVCRVVMADNLSDGDATVETSYELDSYKYDADVVEMDLLASPMIASKPVPGRKVQGWYCPWSYKGTECGYNGDLKTCAFTYEDCRAHFGDDPKRFGGFLGRPQADLVVY